MGSESSSEFIVRILLKARQQVSDVVNKASSAVDNFSKSNKEAEKQADRTSDAISAESGELRKMVDAHIREKKAADDAAAAHRNEANELRKSTQARRDAARQTSTNLEQLKQRARLERATAQERSKQFAEEVTRLRRVAAERENQSQKVDKETRSLRRQAAEIQSLASEEAAKHQVRASQLGRQIAQQEDSARTSNREVRAVNQKIKSLERSANEYDRASSSAQRHIASLERQSSATRRATTATRSSTRANKEHESSQRGVGRALAGNNKSLANLSANFRGLILAFAIKYAQTLATAMVGLGGALGAVASSALQAGGALAGALTAGAAQAIPVIGILAAGLARVGKVFKAVGLENKMAEQSGQDQAAAADKQRTAAEGVRNAADGLRSAQDRVADAHDGVAEAQLRVTDSQEELIDSQRALTEARREARRELEDLRIAEMRGTLGLERSRLNLRSARTDITSASASGSIGELRQARLGAREASVDVRESATQRRRSRADLQRAERGGIEGMSGVVSARQGIEDSRRAISDAREGVQDARENVQDANRAVADARRGLQEARRAASETAKESSASAKALSVALAGLTPAEQKFYRTLLRLQQRARQVFRPITDIIVGGFERAFSRVGRLMENNRLIAGFRGIARGISRALQSIAGNTTSARNLDQYHFFIKEARRNLPMVTRMANALFNTFLSVGRAASPALRSIVRWTTEWAERMERLSASTRGQQSMRAFFTHGADQLRSWVRLLTSVGNLFGALMGAGGARSGKKAVDDMTGAINNMATSVRRNRRSVTEFFENSRRVAGHLWDVLRALGREIIRVFDPRSTKAFSQILIRVLIPALGNVVLTMGAIVRVVQSALLWTDDLAKKFKELTGITVPGGTALLRWAITAGLLVGVFRRLSGVALVLGGNLKLLASAPRALVEGFLTSPNKIITGLRGLPRRLKGLFMRAGTQAGESAAGAAAGETAAAIPGKLARVRARIANAFRRVLRRIGLSAGESAAAGAASGASANMGEALTTGAPAGRFRSAGRRVGLTMGRSIGIGILAGLLVMLPTIKDWMEKNVQPKIEGKAPAWAKNAIPEWMKKPIPMPAFMKKWPGRQTGGFVPGQGAGDVQPIMAEPREFVLRKSAADALGPSNLRELNQGRLPRGRDAMGALARGGARKAVADVASELGSLPTLANRAAAQTGTRLAAGLEAGGRRARKSVEGTRVGVLEDFTKMRKEGIKESDRFRTGFEDHTTKMRERSIKDTDRMRVDVVDRLARMRKEGTKDFDRFGDEVIGSHTRMRVQSTRETRRLSDSSTREIGEMRKSARVRTDRMASDVTSNFTGMRTSSGRRLRQMADQSEKSFGEMRLTGVRRTNQLERSVGSSMTSMGSTVYQGMKYVADATNEALKAFDAKEVKLSIPTPRGARAERKETGGFVGRNGERGRDQQLVMMGRGESVLTGWDQPVVNRGLALGRILDPSLPSSLGELYGGRGRRTHSSAPASVDHVPAFGLGGPFGSGSGHIPVANIARRKFGLKATSGRTNHGRMSQSGNVSDHSWGGAVDYSNGSAPTPGMDAFSAFFKTKLRQVVKQLIWRNKDQHTGYPIGGHMDHVHLGLKRQYALGSPARMAKLISRAMRGVSLEDLLVGGGGGGGEGAADYEEVKKIRVKGPKGSSLTRMAQSSVDKARNAANRKLEEEAGKAGGGGIGDMEASKVGGALTAGEARAIFRRALRMTGVRRNTAAWVNMLLRQAMRESGLNPNAVNKWDSNAKRGDPSKGMLQTIGATFKRFAMRGHDNILNPLDNALAAIRYMIATYGGGNQGRALKTMQSRGGGAYARGGIIPGRLGQALGITAHAGEWVLNSGQQRKLAEMSGVPVSRIRQALGLKRGGASFQGGGEVEGYGLDARDRQGNRGTGHPGDAFDDDYVGSLSSNRERGERGAERRNEDANRRDRNADRRDKNEEKRDSKAEKKDKKPEGYEMPESAPITMEEVAYEFDKAWSFVSRIDRKAKNFVESFVEALEPIIKEEGLLDLAAKAFERMTTRLGLDLGRDTFRVRTDNSKVERALTEVEVMQRTLANLEESEIDLLEQQRMLGKVVTRTNEAIKKTVARMRAIRRGGIRGDEEEKEHEGLTESLSELRTIRTGLEDRKNELDEKINEGLSSRYEAQLALQSKAIDDVNKSATRREASIETRRRVATVLNQNDVLNKLMEDQMVSVATQIDELRKLVETTQDPEVRADLEQQIEDLEASVVELAQQRLGQAIERINNAAQRDIALIDLRGRAMDARGQIGGREGLFKDRGRVMRRQTRDLEDQLRVAEVQKNSEVISTLTMQIEELKVAVQENSRAQFLAEIEEVQAKQTYRSSLNDLETRILQARGELSGNVDQAGLVRLANKRQGQLGDYRNELQELLSKARRRDDEEQERNLTLALKENELALLENTKQIKELQGAMTVQSFTSFSWQQFRQAIFSGMGSIIPRYDIPQAHSGGMVMRDGLFQLKAGELVKTAKQQAPSKSVDVDVNLYQVKERADANEIAQTVVWAETR